MPQEVKKVRVGWEEWLALPKLGLPAIKAKVDTGARTSALHAFGIYEFTEQGKPMVSFGVHPIPERPDIEIYCTAPLVGKRDVTSSNGQTELRHIISTTLAIGGEEWETEISLTYRENMAYRMLLGRKALEGRAIVDPVQSCLCGELSPSLYDDLVAEEPMHRPLKILLLSREPHNYSSRRLVEEAERRGHSMDVINTKRCYMNITSAHPEVRYGGQVLASYDAVIPRIGASVTSYGTAVVRQFEAMNVFCLNSSDAIRRSRDKLYAHQLLAAQGIGMPVTGYASSPSDTMDLIKIVGGAPLVLKLLQGTQGKGVVLAETRKAAESVIDAFRGLDADILVQEFIKEAAGTDIRCFVIGNRVVAAMKRTGSEGDFRSNLHKGGNATKVRITREERATAVKAARVLGLSVAGVDMLRTESGPKVLEVNSSPGLEGIESVTGKNIAGHILDYIEKRAKIMAARRVRQDRSRRRRLEEASRQRASS
ncbi:30S ribosomal protein S6--L-glutamate ligase [Luteithermobacter gelatinilyticus]|uniref:30S ribosomal protein S6--L-glutamate ligase n=1 Tax=Luteithermobacter gelatinilyticus TaxID=2582913 RepID=UPI001105E5F2|nr:30S ribosomal protein S6--L-glutamate ligase [Luteithermobacter gelatinilyticus]|tara:strand:- start:25515 stop:26960 length:1446 start_codon:yes stop_codon:yes gene_type:complete